MRYETIRLKINGEEKEVRVETRASLLSVLRDVLNLTGAKAGCLTGDCGACTVLVNGKPVTSCMMLAVQADGKELLTVEGIAADGHLHPVQQAFIEYGAAQCGFCIPGMVVSAYHLLSRNPNPTEEQIREAIAGNLCRCTGYNKIVEAIQAAAAELSAGKRA